MAAGSGLQFTYYDERAVQVSLLTPRGGPRHGGTRLLVHGAGFRDLGAGVNGVQMQGTKCKFGANDMVNATKTWGETFAARCTAPPDAHFVGTAGMEGRLNQSLRVARHSQNGRLRPAPHGRRRAPSAAARAYAAR